ncbi:MAG: hypothetical protein AB9861_06075 [Methanosarcina sp.]
MKVLGSFSLKPSMFSSSSISDILGNYGTFGNLIPSEIFVSDLVR